MYLTQKHSTQARTAVQNMKIIMEKGEGGQLLVSSKATRDSKCKENKLRRGLDIISSKVTAEKTK